MMFMLIRYFLYHPKTDIMPVKTANNGDFPVFLFLLRDFFGLIVVFNQGKYKNKKRRN